MGPFLWIALDQLIDKEKRTLDIVREIEREVSGNFGYKVNLDWVLKRGIQEARRALPDRPFFLDLKMWNGARTMSAVFSECHTAGVTATNAYALAGAGSSRESGWELSSAINTFRQQTTSTLRIYAVTVLTHYSETYAQRILGRSLVHAVDVLWWEGLRAKVDGIIMPSFALPADDGTKPYLIVLPGLRPSWYQDERHSESYGPELIAGRSDVEAVCGSPIMKSGDPIGSLKKILQAIAA